MDNKDLIAEVTAKAEKWLAPAYDAETQAEVRRMLDNPDKSELIDAFYKDLEFGTGGLRGIMGAGSNRMNIYTVGAATQGLSNYLNKNFKDREQISVVVGHDCRNNSRKFAEISANIFSANGIKVYLFEDMRPTPEMSFAIRHLGCQSGIILTASHNPKEYNGYKAYWDDGAQVLAPHDKGIIEEVAKVSSVADIRFEGNKDLIQVIGKEVDEAYYASIKTLLLHPDLVKEKGKELKLVYTPLHGSGCVPVREILKRIGIVNVSIVAEQEKPDGDFPTVKAPNPEDPAAFSLAIPLADQVGADAILATDPDSDRLGAAVRRRDGGFSVLTGNQIGSLLIHYILSTKAAQGTLPANGLVVKSLVSTRMADAICAHYGVEIRDVLTGFRFISEQIAQCEATGQRQFLFGFEESFGFLAGTFARDKDAICAAMLLSEACVAYREENKTLYDVLQEMYKTYGYFKESVKSYTLEGKAGLEKIAAAMASLRKTPPREFAQAAIVAYEDYKTRERHTTAGAVEPITLPQSDVLRYFLDNGAWLCIRPSGTEPKLKLYIGANAPEEAQVDDLLARLMAAADEMLQGLLA